MEHPADSDTIVATKSVIVVPGVIHGHFANGTLKGDLIPDISVETAHQHIASYTSAFLDLNVLHPSSTQYKLSLATLRKSIADSDDILGGFISAQNEELQGTWCASSQFIIANLWTGDEFRVTNIPMFYDDGSFDFARPNVIHYDNKINITIPFRNKHFRTQVSTLETACKTKSQEALLKELNSTAMGPAKFCSDINDFAIYAAMSRVSKPALTRYQARGAILRSANDTEKSNGLTWTLSSITYKEEKSGPDGIIGANRLIRFSSPRLATKIERIP